MYSEKEDRDLEETLRWKFRNRFVIKDIIDCEPVYESWKQMMKYV